VFGVWWGCGCGCVLCFVCVCVCVWYGGVWIFVCVWVVCDVSTCVEECAVCRRACMLCVCVCVCVVRDVNVREDYIPLSVRGMLQLEHPIHHSTKGRN